MHQPDRAPTPEDATMATDEQRERQDQLDHRNDDPEGPGGDLNRNQMADETGR